MSVSNDQVAPGVSVAHLASRERFLDFKAGSYEVTPSGLVAWWPILVKLGISYHDAQDIASRARLAGVSFQAELLASGYVEETALYRELAHELGLPFHPAVQADRLLMRGRHCLRALRNRGGARACAYLNSDGRTILLIAPDRIDIAAMRRYLRRYPKIAQRMRIVPPSVVKAAVKERARGNLTHLAINGLFERFPHFSARHVVNAWQGAAIGAFVVAMSTCLVFWTWPSLLILHIALSLLFLACVTLRLLAAGNTRRLPAAPPLKAVRSQDMPVYTVLVALYKEAEIVPDLLVALGRLVWPRSKLEVKLVCESDDHETLTAIRTQELRSYIEIIEVPPAGPRTKPKALSYALPMTTGEFVVLYDAEDKPHPFQLVEAWQRFRASGEELACLQAPLVISNRRESWISSMFAFEYTALFHGVLPWLAQHRLVLPLGGTSNHFRRSILERMGGWDPYNVTEDADLGIRLRRLDYHTDTISSPTYEDAPTSLRVWIPQRTRWFKGWLQTWLVHMRDARGLTRELGLKSFLVTQVLFPGMVISALANAALVLTLIGLSIFFALEGNLPDRYGTLLLLDIFNIVLGYGGFLALGWWSRPENERRGLWRNMLLTPAYWLVLSFAAWRAVWHLFRRPHHWEKTPHTPSRHRATQPKRGAPGPSVTALTSPSPRFNRSRSPVREVIAGGRHSSMPV